MLQLTFKQTDSELLVRAAATVLFGTLARSGAEFVSISELAERPQYGFTASAAADPIGPKFVRITDLQDGGINWDSVPFCECADPAKYLLQEDDVLFARTGATTGKTHLVRSPETAVFASYLIRLRPKSGVFAGYLHAFFQSDDYWTQISEEKEGSAQPNVNGEKLSALKIPLVESKLQHAIAEFLRCIRCRQDGQKLALPELPSPLVEQRRVVARIEELAAQIQEIHRLRHEQKGQTRQMLLGAFWALAKGHPRLAMREVAPLIRRPADVEASGSYAELGIRSFGKGAFHKPALSGLELGSKRIFRIENGDLLFSNVFAWEGAIAVAKPQDAGRFGSHRFMSCVPKPDVATAQFLRFYFLTDEGMELIRAASPGGAGRNRTLGLEALANIKVPVPPIEKQRWFDSLQAEVDALKRMQAETAAELDALLPAILDRAFKGEL